MMKQSTSFAQVATNLLNVLQGYSKTIRLLFVMFVALTVSAEVWGATYTKVTSAPADWSGEYIVVYENNKTAHVWTGVDAANCNTTADISSNSVTGDFVTVTIAPMTGGYSIKVNGGTNSEKYIYGTSGSNKLNFGTTAQLNTLSYETDWVKITSNTSVLTFNKASADMRFRYYKAASYGAQQPIQLYKLSTGSGSTTVDPEVTFSNGEYTIGGAALDLSTLWESNSTGAVTYSVTNAGTTGATVNGTSFTATAAGTCTVQASQAATATHNAATATATITVTAPAGGGGDDDSDTWTLVKDVNDLAVGDEIVIAASDYDYALSTTQNSNNRGRAAVTKNGETITFGNDVQVLTLQTGNVSNSFAFYTGSGYLYAASSSSNYLRTEISLSNNSSWSIAITNTGVATITAQGTNTRNLLKYNSSSSIFSCYGSGQSDVSIYKKAGGTTTYTITSTLSHVTADGSNPTTITSEAEDLTLSYSAESGWNLPATISVTMGGTPLSSETDYDWDNGDLLIAPASGFTGDIVVTINGWQQLAAPTGLNVSNITSSGATLAWNAVTHATSYTVQVYGENDEVIAEYPGLTEITKTVSDLAPETNYVFGVVAVGDGITYTNSIQAVSDVFTTASAICTVTYNANGGVGTAPTEPTEYSNGATVTVLGNFGKFTNEGYAFTGWNTKADGSGESYKHNDQFTITTNTTLYAQWCKAYWKLVTDNSEIEDDTRIVIAAKDYNYALSTDQKTNNRGQAAITKKYNTITFGADVQTLSLVGLQDNKFALYTGSGCLYAAGSDNNNYLRTRNSIDGNCYWSIAISQKVAGIYAQGESQNNQIKYDNTNSLFSCYGEDNSQKDVVIYKEVCVQDQYSVTSTLTNTTATTTNPTTVAATATTLTLKYSANTGFLLPETIIVKMGGVELVSGTDYTWNKEDGTLTFSVTGFYGDIDVKIVAEEDPCYQFEMSEVTATSTTPNSVTLTWTEVTGATGYNVKLGTGEFTAATGLTHTFEGLTPKTTYNWEVQAVKGTCQASQTGSITTQKESFTITWLANGQEHHVQTYVEGTAIEIPVEPEATTYVCDDKVFVGWIDQEISGSTDEEPDFITDFGNVKENKSYYAVFATPSGNGFTLGQSGDFKIYANVEGNNIYAATYNNGKLTSTYEDISAVTFKFTHKENNQYTIYNGSQYVAYGTEGTDLKIQSDEYLWTIAPATNKKGSWRVTSVQYPSRAIIYRTGYDFKAYGTNNITTNGYYDIEIGGATTYTEYVTSCVTCENVLTISKGNEENGTFTLDKVGEQETCDGLSVIVTPTPAEHYSVSAVTATTPTSGGAPTVTNNGNGTWTVTYKQNSTGESTINVNFVQDAKASITLSELGVTTTDNTTYYVGEQYTLPTTSSQSCDGKQLVGWSTVEVAETDTKPTENYYELGAEVTLAATQTFYAVFATAGEGGVDNTDYSNVHTSNVTLTNEGGTNATDSKVNIGGMDYTAVKAGTGSAKGAVKITVPAGTTKLSFHMAGWNGEGNKTISLSGATADPSSFRTVADAGVSGSNTTYTLSGTIANYFYSTTLSNIDAETTLTFSNGGADQRFVIWGVNTSTGGGVSYTGYTTSCVPTYSITYDFAGGTGSHCSNTTVPQGDPYTICDEAPTKEGNTFLHWSDGGNTYNPSDVIANVTTDITLTAVWQPNTYTVTWSNNGTTTPVDYNHGDALVVPTAASCDGVKEFVGWTEQSGYYHATTAPTDLFKTTTATVTADATYYAVFATKGEGSANFVLGESGTFKMYANVEGTNYYAQGGVSSSKITSTTEAANASDYTLTHKGNNQYTIQLGNAYIGHSGTSSTDLNTTETTWTIQEGVNGSWRIVSPVNTSRALAYRASTYKIFKAYSMTSVEAGDTEYYDIEFGGTSSGYSDYTTICQQIESIEVQNPQTEFYLTDDFTIGEGKVIATLSGGETADVTALATFSGYNMEVVGTYTVTVTYMGATATYNINVKPLDNAWVLTWNVSGKTNTGLGPRTVTKGFAIGTLPVPEVPAACEGKTFMGWTKSNTVPSDGIGIVYITPETVPTDNTTYYAVFATVNNFCTQKPIDQIASGSKVVIVAVASLTDDGGAGKAISSRATDDTYNLQGDDVAIYDQTINTPHSTCIWTITKSGEKYIFTQDGKYLNGIIDGSYSNLKYNNTSDSWRLPPAASGMAMTYNMNSTNASTEYVEWYNGKFTIHDEVNDQGDFDMQFYVTANADGKADITDYTTGCEEYTITYYGFRGGYSTSTSSDGIIVLPVNSLHTVPNCGDVVTDHTNLGREFLNVWMTQPHGGQTFKPGDTFILTQDTTLYAQWELNTTTDVTLPTGVEDLAGTDVYVYGGNTLTMVPDIVTINSLTLKGGLQPDGSYQMPNVWIPDGATLVRNTNKIYLDLAINAENWYPFAVPFATKNDQYLDYLDPVLRDASTYGKHFAIKTYNGARRAEVGEDKANNWKQLLRHTGGTTSYLEPGVGYIISAVTYPEKDTATIRIPMTVPNTWFENGEQIVVGSTSRNTIAVTAHTGAAATEHQRHAGWNFIASPYLSEFAGNKVDNDGKYIKGWIDIAHQYNYEDTDIPYVTIPVYNFEYYEQKKVSEATLSPEWSFFVQIAESGTINFVEEGRQTVPAGIAARTQEERSVKMDIDINLTDGRSTDQMGIIVCEKYSDAYEIGRDLEKMFGSAYNLVVYSLMNDNTPLAYQAVPLLNETHAIPIGYRAPEQGEYTFSLKQNTSSIDLLNEQYEQLVLVDYEKGALTNLLNSDYTFSSERTQSNSRFALYAVPRQDSSTELPNISDEEDAIRKIFYNGHLFIIRNGNVYNGNGQIVK